LKSKVEKYTESVRGIRTQKGIERERKRKREREKERDLE
jgi:hypothetical protein